VIHDPVSAAASLASYHQVSAEPRSVGLQVGVAVVVAAGLLPWALAAVIETPYAMWLVRPVIVHEVVGGVEVHERVAWPDAVAVTVYDSSGA
jgi:hypothetical protein